MFPVSAAVGFVARSQDKHRIAEHHGCVSEEPPESRPVPPPDPDPAPDPGHTRVIPPEREPAGPKPRFADRLWSLRAVIAVALASVILGGLAGAALANAGDDHDGDFRMRPGMGPGGGPRGLQPGQPQRPPGAGQWYWRDGPRGSERRGFGQRQWDQDGPQNPFPSGVPTPKAKPTPSD